MTYDFYIVWFTVKQAVISTFLTVPLGFLMARAIVWNYSWLPARLMTKLLGLPLITPSLVGILGFITIMGAFLNIYSLTGIILAHVVFYSPFVALLLVNAWRLIPEEHYRLSEQLRFSSWYVFLYIEIPQLRKFLFEVSWICFCLFLNTFTTIMLLGGGPQKTTLSLALYQSLFFFYDLDQGVKYASFQLLLTSSLALLTFFFKVAPQATSLKQPSLPRLTGSFQRPIIWGTLIIVSAPLLAILSLSLPALPHALHNPLVWRALAKSLSFALLVGPLAVGIALALVLRGWSITKSLASLYFILPPAFLGALLFFLSLKMPYIPSEFFLVSMQIIFIFPLVFRLIDDTHRSLRQVYDPTLMSLGLSPFQTFSLIKWPLLKKPIATALGLACALSVGDFPSLAFFASPDNPGLSNLLYQQIGYYFNESMGTACVLLFACYFLYQLPHWILRPYDRTYTA